MLLSNLSACHSFPNNCAHHLWCVVPLKMKIYKHPHLSFFLGGSKFRLPWIVSTCAWMCIWLSSLRLVPIWLRISSIIPSPSSSAAAGAAASLSPSPSHVITNHEERRTAVPHPKNIKKRQGSIQVSSATRSQRWKATPGHGWELSANSGCWQIFPASFLYPWLASGNGDLATSRGSLEVLECVGSFVFQ